MKVCDHPIPAGGAIALRAAARLGKTTANKTLTIS
jgi:hypothetical protein